MSKTVRIVSNIVYGIGAAMTVSLCCIALFGPAQPVNPDAMLPATWREQAFIWLGCGALPMLLACMAVYRFNMIKAGTHKKRNFLLVFLPGFICGACAFYMIGIVIIGLLKTIFYLLTN